jgi:hypothetical protein
MRGSPSDEQIFLGETVRHLAKTLDPATAWSTLEASGFTKFCTVGASSTMLDVAIIVESLAEFLCPSPFVGSAMMAGSLQAKLGIESAVPTAVVLDDGLHDLLRVGAGEGTAWDCVPGTTVYALADDGHTVVAGVAGEEIGNRFDLDRPCCVDCDDWRPVGNLDDAAHARWLAGALIGIGAELCGLMKGSLDAAVTYAKNRQQFGRPIGSFQALQHLLAAAHVKVESVRSAVYAAADILESEDPDAALAMARVAKAHASAQAINVIETSLQLHGGIGMTWEYPGHRYLRRAWLDALTLGDAAYNHSLIAGRLLSSASDGLP